MVLVFDLGATKLRMALLENDVLGEIHRFETDRSEAGFAKFLEALEELATGHTLSAVVGGIAGQLTGEDGVLSYATNLQGWLGIAVVRRIHELLNCPVQIRNDVEVCGLGESRYGAGTTSGVMAYYTVSTGVNAVRLVQGKVDVSIRRFELGKQLVLSDTGQLEMLEPLIGGAAIEHKYRMHPSEIKDPKVWAQVTASLGTALYNTIVFWNPDLIVFGGSMMRDINLDELDQGLGKLADWAEPRPKLVRASLGDEAGLRGAVALAKDAGFR